MKIVQTSIAIVLVSMLLTGTILVGRGINEVATLKNVVPNHTPFMRVYTKSAVQLVVGFNEISPTLKRAVIIAEDVTFYEHPGIAWQSLLNSIIINLSEGRIVMGASSITMQLAKNIFLGPERTLWRKFKELTIAATMECLLSKDRILDLYLNVAEWGPRVFGAEAAARYYFNKHASELTSKEAAYLASLLPNPKLTTSKIYCQRFARAAANIHERMIR